ncbi:uncharacterized protein LOC130665785 [Microplitis mediator]|uniref:uncharacterized protein LOC130665785 n=1 Tax=Microplitis mediator TaxID=375433 RepID=UPI0025554845|nr:uncharacterized protein LOC130665785 [Microplitis mediator]XP_057322358.1 uncharacterized protein LOC130665785 [Microplitis mediator]
MSKQKLYLLLVVSVALFATKTWAQESPKEEQKEEQPMPEEGGEGKCLAHFDECEDDDECCDGLICKNLLIKWVCDKEIDTGGYEPEKIEAGEPIPEKSKSEEPESETE